MQHKNKQPSSLNLLEILKWFFLVLATLLVGLIIIVGILHWYMVRLVTPNFNRLIDNSHPSEFTYQQIKIDDVPNSLTHATVALEDPDFFAHYSYDWMSVFRVIFGYFRGERSNDLNSPISQQLVKVSFEDERPLNRVFRSFFLEILLNQRLNKSQILELYFNKMIYGRKLQGIGAAAQTYFHKPVSELTLAESAILAGIPQSPTRYSPFSGNIDDSGQLFWKLRAEVVLKKMMEQSYITESEYMQANEDLQSFVFTEEK